MTLRIAATQMREPKQRETTPEERAWAAGFFDGEGSVTIHRQTQRNRHTYYALSAVVGNTNKAAVERLQHWFGGNLHLRSSKGKLGRKPVWQWRVQSSTGAAFLRAVRPYLIIKAAETDIALRLQSIIRAKRETWRRLSAEDLAERESLRQELLASRRRTA